MSNATTLSEMWWPLMDMPDITPGFCIVCGRRDSLAKHHPVFRSAGELYEDGVKRRKPVVHLCGFGNNAKDADGRWYCHGKAHAHLLHFRYDKGYLEVLETEEATNYLDALQMDGWRSLIPIPDETGWRDVYHELFGEWL